jgi:S1-C subfamily serine protease
MLRKALAPLVLLAALSAPAAALDGTQVYQRARPSMVQVVGITPEGRYNYGSGVRLPNGTVVTNCHVTQRAARVQIFLSGGGSAQLQAADIAHDLCALYFPELERAPAELGTSRALSVGDRIYAVGFNAGKGLSYQPGEVAELFVHDGGMVMRITAPFTHGASGGGLFDADGRLVGILTFLRPSPAGTYYFAVPVEWLDGLNAVPAQAVAPLDGTPFWAEVAERQPAFLRTDEGAVEKH